MVDVSKRSEETGDQLGKIIGCLVVAGFALDASNDLGITFPSRGLRAYDQA